MIWILIVKFFDFFIKNKWLLIVFGIIICIGFTYHLGWTNRGTYEQAKQAKALNDIIIQNAKDRAEDAKVSRIYQMHLQTYQDENRKLKKRLNDVKKIPINADCSVSNAGVQAINDFNDATK